MHRLGVGTMHKMTDFMQGLFLGSLQCREYTLGENVGSVPSVGVPVYFIHGSYDYTVSYPLAKVYLEQLRAPVTGFYTFDRSAHSPMFEEPDKTMKILREDVLAGTAGQPADDAVDQAAQPRGPPVRGTR